MASCQVEVTISRYQAGILKHEIVFEGCTFNIVLISTNFFSVNDEILILWFNGCNALCSETRFSSCLKPQYVSIVFELINSMSYRCIRQKHFTQNF